MLSYQFSVLGQVNDFAVVVGLNSSVRVAGIRDEEYVLLLIPLFRYETMAAESWVGSHQSLTLMLAIVAPPFFYLSCNEQGEFGALL